MARLMFFSALLLVMFGGGKPAGWLLAAAVLCVLGWLAAGPKARWLL